MSEETKNLVRQQFGASAAAYATSAVHAQGASLGRLIELVQPQPTWEVLDVATGAGHTALALAPHVQRVVGSDLTPQMISQARALAAARGISNATFEMGDVEKLPFRPGSFDLVTCRVALHHFPQPERALAEMVRVCRRDGLVAVIDNIVPADPPIAKAVNSFEKMRDPSHVRALTLQELSDLFQAVGLIVTHTETMRKPMDFYDWLRRMAVSAPMSAYLEAWLLDPERSVHAFFQPVRGEETISMMLTEGIIIGRR